MLLTEYDEQAHIESEREIAKEEGQERVNTLIRLLIQNNRTDDVLKAVSNKEFQKKLFNEFGI